ncbi:MAG: hypothetical protein JXJ17_12975 [Anaerolineae bacterium]|nr:hypothetical protein [Anaerolineae bacterium]
MGRYTLKYFLLLAGYLVGVLIWLGIAAGLAIWLNGRHLDQLRQYIGEHLNLWLGGLGIVIAGIVGFRCALLSLIIVLPGSYASTMAVVPALFLVPLIVLVALIADPPLLDAADQKLNMLPRAIIEQRQLAVIVGFCLIAASYLIFLIRPAFWDHVLGLDSSVHIYLGQHVLDGGIPYHTIFYIHPPMRFVVSLLWSLGAALTGLSVVTFSRLFELGISVGVLAALYAVGREFTGRKVGGLLAAVLLLGTEHMHQLLITGPTFRLTTVLFMLLGIWMAQRKRWFWAGLFGSAAALLWAPASISLAAMLIAALLQKEQPKLRAIFLVVSGAMLLAGILYGGLLIVGSASEAFRQNVSTVWNLVSSKFVPGQDETAASSRGFFSKLRWFGRVFKWLLRGDWELAALMVVGFPILFIRHGLVDTLRRPELSVLTLSTVLMAGAFWLNFDGSMRDSIMLVVLLAPFGAGVPVWGINRLTRLKQVAARSSLLSSLEWFAAGLVLLLGLADSFKHQDYLYSSCAYSLAEQTEMANELAGMLEPGQTVLGVGSLWYQALTDQQNPSPVIQLGGLAKRALRISGWTDEAIVESYEQEAPLVVMIWPEPGAGEIAEWLDEYYHLVGEIDPDNGGFSQQVYIRQGNPEIEELLEGWPLTSK